MAKTYNYIFTELVHDENDLIGLIAYGLYKKHKIEFIKSFKAANPGQEPSDDDCKAFAMISCTPSALKQYRDNAETLLQQITLTAAREEINSFEDDMLHQYRQEISSALAEGKAETLSELGAIVKAQLPSWWSSFGASVAGALVFSIIIYIGFTLGSTSEQNNVKLISNAIESVSNINHTDSVHSADTTLIKK